MWWTCPGRCGRPKGQGCSVSQLLQVHLTHHHARSFKIMVGKEENYKPYFMAHPAADHAPAEWNDYPDVGWGLKPIIASAAAVC